MLHLRNFSSFTKIFEGGSAIKSSRSIRQSEFPLTLSSLKSALFEVFKTKDFDDNFLIIGSIGKKPRPEDESGDIDVGYDFSKLSSKLGVSTPKEAIPVIEERLADYFEREFGQKGEFYPMPGLNILSVGWPIKGDPEMGFVQLDLIAITNMEWAKFAYHCPDYSKGESRYKAAHRNWLLQAIASAQNEVLTKDDDGLPLEIYSQHYDYPNGFYRTKKTFEGNKGRLKSPKKIEERELITKSPQEFVNIIMGPGFSLSELGSFEDVLKAIKSPKFKGKELLPKIKEEFVRYIDGQKGKLEMPSEINTL